jgi:hypothetical protein
MDLFGGEIPVLEVWETATGEIEAALTLTFRAAQRRLGLAETLVREHPKVWEALFAGRIDMAKAHVIVDGLTGTASHIAEEVTEKILEKASGWTTGQIRARLKKLVAEADPAAAVEAYEEGMTERRVVADQNPDGTANLCGWNLPADRVAEARARINQIARSLKTRDESRTLDQLRADVFLDLLCGREHHTKTGRKGVVDIRVDLETPGDPWQRWRYGLHVRDATARACADPGRDPRPQVGLRGPVLQRAGSGDDPTKLLQRRGAFAAACEMQLQLRPLARAEFAVQVLGQPVRPYVTAHPASSCRSSCLFTPSARCRPPIISPGGGEVSCEPGATETSRCPP